ncbi:phage tail sheath C-terminal domain-containing protein [Silvibacterium acidisoli]|uniref:phage tail sheath C-terminal domain-containing protein n=1 Tax=Acidobacteriaceae bacterium ZG23-2 TaxID=2883246 RepID=UPI00406BF279
MPVTPTYPGVYIQELPSPVHSIAAVATSITAFVGYTARGIDNRAEEIFSFSDFERLFGGIASNSELSYAVQQFFQNGGAQAYVVRTPATSLGAASASVTFDGIEFLALSSGTWADGELLVDIDTIGVDLTADPLAFNVTITDLADNTTEYFPSVTLASAKSNFITAILNDPDNGSQLVKVSFPGATPTTAPTVSGVTGAAITTASVNTAVAGSATGATATQDFSLKVSTSFPATAPAPMPITVKVFGSGSAVPQTLAGLASKVQQAMNAVLAVQMPGASVQCTVAPSGTGQALRINALLPQNPDAVVTFASTGSGGDASAALGLSAPVVANVAHYTIGSGNAHGAQTASVKGKDGTGLPQTADIIGDHATFTGIYALDKVDLFNLLSIPDAARALASDPNAADPSINALAIYSAAITMCDQRRAFLLCDPPPNVNSVLGAVDWISDNLGVIDPNGAAFFPRLRLADPANNYQLRTFAPSGVVAGVYASIDGSRGVWKAPAGIEATLNGVQSMTYKLSDPENGVLNPLGLNCFRNFPVYGSVLWGARTLVGADAMTNQWKYVPVRRMALFLEESLYRGTKWVVFEPNDEPLWAAIRLNIGAFMQTYFLKGAFQGQTPDQAYFVKCDSETTTQTDIDNGVVNILVGFAPLKPAEFVVIQIEQLTGQAQS